MKKNILFVVDEKRMGGVSVLLQDILNRLNLNKYNIDLLILNNSGNCFDELNSKINVIYGTKTFSAIDLTLKQAIKTKNIKKIYLKLKMIYLMKRKKINKLIIKERKRILNKTYDVEIAFKDGFCAIFTAYGNSKKKYTWLHTDYKMYDCTANYRPLFEEIFPKFDKIIAISKSVKERFKEKYHLNNIHVIYNLINVEKIKKKKDETIINYDKNKINLISVGRFHNMKGYDRLIDVMHKLDEENLLENVKLRLIGDGEDYNLIKSKIDKYALNDYIELLGLKKNPFPYVFASDCFLMCSRYEPFGLVVIEALTLGVPVISTDVASIKEIMTKDYGFITENSVDGYYNGLKKIIKNPTLIKKYKQNLKKYKYDTTKIMLEIEELLDEK